MITHKQQSKPIFKVHTIKDYIANLTDEELIEYAEQWRKNKD